MDYYDGTKKVLEFLKEKRVCASSRASHRECYLAFGEHMKANGLCYSIDAVKQWIDSIRSVYSRQKCYFWNQYMIQLAEMISSGAISDRRLYQTTSSYSKVPDLLKPRLDEYLDFCRDKYTKLSWKYARIYCSEVMLFLSEQNISKIEDIVYQDIIGLYNAEFYCTDDIKSILIGHAARMMSFFSEKGLCSRGYSIMLDSQMYPHIGILAEFSPDHQAEIEQLRPKSLSFPAHELYNSIDGFVCSLQKYGYVGNTIYLARHLLTALYLFLEIHKLGYAQEVARIWFAEVQDIIGCSWKHWRRVLSFYEEYSDKNDIIPGKKYRYKPGRLESLPQWCREPIISFQKQKLREFRSEETVKKYQYPCIRFCLYLIGQNISAFDNITIANIREFSSTDQHDTFKGRASYFTVVRQFLEYLEERDVIHNNSLHNCLSAGTAPVEKIVDTLTDEQISSVNDYRLSQSKPIELRNSAMVMIGLKMGLRASDVVNLKFDDIDWKKRQITIVQQKTQAQITLPMPVDVGNSIYSYIKNGRPKSSNEHVFIRHKAPYCKLTIKICTKSLHGILPERKAVIGGGFHVTRRTFATRLLRNNACIETVINSLGHQDRTSVMTYLSLDEERMQSCALSLSETGLRLKKGELL